MAEPLTRSRPPLVLVVNDQEWSTRSLESILGPHGYAVLRAYNARMGLERVRTAQADLIVLDANLPDMEGVELCRLLRADPAVSAATPIIMTTAGHATRQQRLAALRAGAWDYLGHPLDAEDVILRFDSYVAAKIDSDRAREQSLLDGLTGFYNVQGLGRRARELAAQAFRAHSALACVVLTVDVGEDNPEETTRAVERLADVIKRTGRVSDAVGRVGDSELAVFAPETDARGAERFAKRLQQILNEETPNQPVKLRAGYDAVRDYRQASIEPVDLLTRASSALRRSRQNGGTSWIQPFEVVVTSVS